MDLAHVKECMDKTGTTFRLEKLIDGAAQQFAKDAGITVSKLHTRIKREYLIELAMRFYAEFYTEEEFNWMLRLVERHDNAREILVPHIIEALECAAREM